MFMQNNDSTMIEKELAQFIVKELKEKEIEEKHRTKAKRFKIKESPLGEEIFSSIVHGIGTLIASAALVLLVIWANNALEITAVTIFASASIVLFTMSCLYHAFPHGTTKRVFKRFDHLSIYLLIAGTYTPFALLTLGGKMGWVLFSLQWGLALFGVIFKSIWINKYNMVHVMIFLLMGWSILFFNPIAIYHQLTFNGFMYLLAGGLSYSIGVIFYVFPIVKFNHAIWHFFVLFGNVFHFFCLLFYVL
jgi:hemolysin III